MQTRLSLIAAAPMTRMYVRLSDAEATPYMQAIVRPCPESGLCCTELHARHKRFIVFRGIPWSQSGSSLSLCCWRSG